MTEWKALRGKKNKPEWMKTKERNDTCLKVKSPTIDP